MVKGFQTRSVIGTVVSANYWRSDEAMQQFLNELDDPLYILRTYYVFLNLKLHVEIHEKIKIHACCLVIAKDEEPGKSVYRSNRPHLPRLV